MAIHDLQHEDETLQQLFRALPSVNEVLLIPACRSLLDAHPRGAVLRAAREALAAMRSEISAGLHSESSLKQKHHPAARGNCQSPHSEWPLLTSPSHQCNRRNSPHQPRPRSAERRALRHVVEVAQDYCNLELDLETGLRSRRDSTLNPLCCAPWVKPARLNADSHRHGVIIVNNCAAATMLALNSLAEKSEVIVSRGELVEIGGGFRIPEILEKSGAILKEVGTTNRTRLADYDSALGPGTGLLLRVHQSNFSIEGFTERPSLQDLVELSKRAGIPLFEDQGTGLLSSLERFGISGEPSLLQSFESGVDLIAASGDKLLGGPQCGILVGRIDLIDRIRKNPLLRALRVDKLTYAALEGTLLEHLSEETSSIPVERMLSIPPEDLMRRCREVAGHINSSHLVFDIVPVDSLVGGGTAPKATLQSCAISLRHTSFPAVELLARLRKLEPPIIGRISDDTVLLDLRTVPPEFDDDLASLLSSL